MRICRDGDSQGGDEPTSTADNKSLGRRFFAEIFNEQNPRTVEKIIAPGFVTHHPQFPDGIHGHAGLYGVIATFRSAFPDLHYTPEDIIAEGDKVVVPWAARGTQHGAFQGLLSTGKPVVVTGIDIFRISAGQLVEGWVASDLLGLLQQLGALPQGPA